MCTRAACTHWHNILFLMIFTFSLFFIFSSLQKCDEKWKKEALVFRWSGYYINIAKSWIKKILKWSNNRGERKKNLIFFNAIQNNHIISELIKYYFIHFLRYQKLGENQIILELFFIQKNDFGNFFSCEGNAFKDENNFADKKYANQHF